MGDVRNKDNARNLKIVHRKCYELKQKQKNDLEDDDRLKPKLYDKNQTISKIEEHFNENGASLALSQIEKKQKKKAKKRKIEHLFNALEGNSGLSNGGISSASGFSSGHVSDTPKSILKNGKKKRKLNDGTVRIEKKKIVSEKEELDDDDLEGIGIDDIEEEQQLMSSDQEHPVSFSLNNNDEEQNENNNANEENVIEEAEMPQNDEANGDAHNDDGGDEQETENLDETANAVTNQEEEEETIEEVKATESLDDKLDNIDLDDLENVDLDEIDLDDIELEEDEGDDGDADDIVLFDPEAYNEPSYGYRRY